MSSLSDYYNNKVATGCRKMINEGNVGWDFFLNDKPWFPFYFYEREEGKLGDISAIAKGITER